VPQITHFNPEKHLVKLPLSVL